ncbi:MAG TPA: MarR family transcriptional regulator [Actinomycetota bacterium]|jgi:DNA-binding MarR family transcriptional regulator|nr:MarR family transcriptional regulator [Actinomycetota bacterium]
MQTVASAALQEQIVAFIRAFGLHRPDHTACGQPVSVSEAHALMELAAAESLRPASLAQRLRLEKSTVSRLVRQLEKRSWVTRAPDPEDGRAVQLRLTDAGRDAADKLARSRADKFDALMRALPEEQRGQIINSFRTLVEVLDG